MRTKTIVPGSLHTETDRVFGFSLTEDSSAAASVTFRAGAADGDVVIGPINLAADESALIVLGKATFWEFPGGCWVKEESGSIEGVLYH